MMDGRDRAQAELAADPNTSAPEAAASVEPDGHIGLWQGDLGTLPFDARCALIRLIKGPYLMESDDQQAWRALIAYKPVIASRLADLFLDLTIDLELNVAFARNADTGELVVPKTARSHQMSLLDSIMALTLRRELLLNGSGRVFIGQSELFESLTQYRNLDTHDPASFTSRLKTSWNRLVEGRLLIKSDSEDRFEISPVLKLIVGTKEAEALLESYTQLLSNHEEAAKATGGGGGSAAGAEPPAKAERADDEGEFGYALDA